MKNRRRSISIGMLIIFGVLLLKGFLPVNHTSESCDEFGHIHKFSIQALKSSTIQENAADEDTDENCHSGKSISSHVIIPVFEIEKQIYIVQTELIPFVKVHYQSPVIEPLRRPPKPT